MRSIAIWVLAGVCATTWGCGGDDDSSGSSAQGGTGASSSGGSGNAGSGGAATGGAATGGSGNSGGVAAGGSGGVATGGTGNAGSGGASTGGGCYSTLVSSNNDLIINLDVAGLVSCNQDIAFKATGGSVCAEDDGSGGYFYTVQTIALTDVPPVSCGLATLSLTALSIVNNGDSMNVVVPQSGGPMVGNQWITVNGTVSGSAIVSIPPTPLADFNGILPEGDVTFENDETSVTYADTSTVIAMASPEVTGGVTVDVTLTGLTGSLTFGR